MGIFGNKKKLDETLVMSKNYRGSKLFRFNLSVHLEDIAQYYQDNAWHFENRTLSLVSDKHKPLGDIIRVSVDGIYIGSFFKDNYNSEFESVIKKGVKSAYLDIEDGRAKLYIKYNS